MAAMTDALRRQWQIWHITLAIYLLLLGAAYVASTPRVTVVTLQPHVEEHLNVFSPLGHDIYMELEFRRGAAKGNDDSFRTMELGGVRWTGGGNRLMLPGQPVVLEIGIDDELPVRFTAMPASRNTHFIVARSLQVDGILPASFTPEERAGLSKLTAHPGLNHLAIRVVQVGDGLRGEDVELIAHAPMRVVRPQPGYGIFVVVFWLLPVAMMGFIVSGIWLLIRGARARREDDLA
jgi:hypothetical protein